MAGAIRFGAALQFTVDPYHCCLILSDTKTDADDVILVRVTTASRWADKTCVLTPADWPELDRESAVAYATAKIGKVKAHLEKQVANGLLVPIPPPPPDVLRRIVRLVRIALPVM
jgi:hypothetical protein